MPRIAYWTSAFNPEMEAVASEIAVLRRHFPSSIVWGISSARVIHFSWRRGFGFRPQFYLFFRAITWLAQRAFHVNHIFGGLNDWFHLKSAVKQPIVLTVALQGESADPRLLERVRVFAVEWPEARQALVALGVDENRVRLIYPAVDLARFYPQPYPNGPFTVLFASSPDRRDWLDARGMPLLLDAAERLPDVRFRLLWRPWGDAPPVIEREIQVRELRDVELVCARVADMPGQYANVHATVAPFTDLSRCKPMPNSLLESMACGRPVLLTDIVPLADIVRSTGSGAVFMPSPDALCEGIKELRTQFEVYGQNARRAAEHYFSANIFAES